MPPRKKVFVKTDARRRPGRLATYSNPAMSAKGTSPRVAPAAQPRYQGPSAKKREKGVNFQDKLEIEQEELESEIRHTLAVIHRVKRDNERLLRKQTLLYGATLDTVEDIKRNTENVKQANQTLYEEMEHVKNLHAKLEAELQEARTKYDESISILKEGKKEQKQWTVTEDEYEKSEARCNEMVKTNRNLRVLLIKHRINPNTDARELDKDTEVDERGSVKSSKSLPPKVAKRKSFVKGRSISDLRHSTGDEIRKKLGPVAIEHVNPAYLGFYKQLKETRDIKEHHKVEQYRTGIDLPKIELIRGKRTAYGSYLNLFQLER